MKINLEIKKKYIVISMIIVMTVVIGYGIFYLIKYFKNKNSKESSQTTTINQNISPELKELPDRLYLFLALKDSFIMSEGYTFDSQILHQKILIYPESQNKVNYKGVEFLEEFQGILLSYGSLIKNGENFKELAEKMLQSYREKSPDSDATGKFLPDNNGKEKFVVNQTVPYKMIETLLNRQYIIDIISYEKSEAYNKIVDTYSSESPFSSKDLLAILELQQKLVKAYEEQNPEEVFVLLSNEAQKNNSIDKIKQGTDFNLFKDKINNEFTAFYYRDGNYILQSKVHFKDNNMMRLNIYFQVDFDGEKNNWSINSYSIKNKEKFLP